MKKLSSEVNLRRSLGSSLFLLLTVFLACRPGEDSAQAQTPPADTLAGEAVEGTEEVGTRDSRQTSPRISAQEQSQQPIRVSEMGYDLGQADAPVKVLEISDFGCGYCRRFHEETFPPLREIYVDGGYVEWKYIPFVLGIFPNGLEAATAAECAGEQDRFFDMQGRLFAEQGGWRNSEDPFAFFSAMAGDAGLDVGRFNRCIEGGWRDNQIRANIRLGQQAGTRGTPLFIVDGRPIPGALPLADFRSVLDAALVQRGVTPPPR